MRDRVRLIAAWFGLPPRQIIGLLTEAEVECLVVEATALAAANAMNQRTRYVSIERTN